MKQFLLLLTGLLCASLSACGGGGGGSGAPSGFNSTVFQGDWQRNDGSDTTCFVFNNYGGTFWGLNRPSTITDATLTSTVVVFSDAACVTKVGLLTRTASLTWSAGAVAGKTNVARVLMTITGFATTKDTDGSGTGNFTGMAFPAGVVTKALLAVDGSLLYVDQFGSPLDADGYPTTLMPTALYKR